MQGQFPLSGKLLRSFPPIKATRVTFIFPFLLIFFAAPRPGPVPAGGTVGVRMAPADPQRRKRAPKKWLFASEAFIKAALRRGSVGPPGLPKEAGKTQVLLCKCTLRNGAEKPLGGAGGEGKEGKKRTYVCYSFIQSHALCQSSFTSLGASGKAAQKQSLLLGRTRLMLLRRVEKA